MKIVMVTIGSLGDLHPFIAIGRALGESGCAVTLAVPADHVERVHAAGLKAVAILPDFASICARLGMDATMATEQLLTRPGFVLDHVLMPSLGSSTDALAPLARDADVIVGSVFALAAGLIAEACAIPLVSLQLQPMAMFSTWQPPRAPGFGMMRGNPGPIGRGWNRFVFDMARRSLRSRHAAAIDRVRRDHGLPATRTAPLIDPSSATRLLLCCYSAMIGPLQPDAPAYADIIGFPFFDEPAPAHPLLDAFLREGPAPLVMSLGSVAPLVAERLYREMAAAAASSGARAVLLTGRAGEARRDGSVLSLDYVPHHRLFPHADLIVHHGGIGTTGQAMRAGRPQIIVPHFGDQFDNARRIETLGLGHGLRRGGFSRDTVVARIAAMRQDTDYAARAQAVAATIATEQGIARAVARIRAIAADKSSATR